ncbi:acylamino-acid-releasing enzyme [Cucumis melo var. makuwa]|uniref:acylaminoacyl-peptidase n=2 Tax=Cucumis melo TaxID=3656 RepID=A0A5D3E4H1_CUCMM|nr:acylamino-acid-releasing enzyme [Cucumis melo var. makuwa]
MAFAAFTSIGRINFLRLPLYPAATTTAPSPSSLFLRPIRLFSRQLSAAMVMDGSTISKVADEFPSGIDPTTEEEYAEQSKLLQEFTKIPNIDRAWTFKSDSGDPMATFSISQASLLANKRRKYTLSAHISKGNDGNSVNFTWTPFPIEMIGVSTIVPSPSGSKFLTVRNPENDSPVQLEIWSAGQIEKEFHIPQSIHGSIYTDGWFEGISWNSNETYIAYVAEEPSPSKPTFTFSGYQKGCSANKDSTNWKGQGDFKEDWGEAYAGKRQPALFVINIDSGEVRHVKIVEKSLSVGQVIWAPSIGEDQYLVFVGWSSEPRKLGMIYCYNRPCALYAVKAPDYGSEINERKLKDEPKEDFPLYNLTQSISSAFFPRFSPDGKFLVFLSAHSSVNSGAHSATNSLHRINWPRDGKPSFSENIVDVVPVVHYAENELFPGLYSHGFLSNPWLSDGHTVITTSIWRSKDAILSIDILSGEVSCISPANSNFSWKVLALDGDNVVAVSSSPVDIPQLKYGCLTEKESKNAAWSWLDVSSPVFKCSEKVKNLLSSLQFSTMKIPVKDVSNCLTKGASEPFEAIFVSSKSVKGNELNPLIVNLHGGPHSTSISSFSKSLAFLSSIGFNLLVVNYRGSLGFGEEALQSLPGKIGTQDVNDVLTALDHIIDKGLASSSKVAVLGGSHGGFLTTHLIGQAPDRFVAAAARNPVCNLALMVGTSDIPDWCYVECYGKEGKNHYTEAPSAEHLTHLYNKSPILHVSKVKTPTIFLLGAKDLRVPFSNGLQYARALREKGVEVKVIMFPDDVHPIDRPQSDFESFLNIGVWFRKYCK